MIFQAEDTGRFLIAHRSEIVPEPGTWAGWGGRTEKGESPAQTAVREAKEESGYEGPMDLSHLHRSDDDGFVYDNFLAIVPVEFKPSLNWENQGYQWTNFDPLPEPLHPKMGSVIYALANKVLEDVVGKVPVGYRGGEGKPQTEMQKAFDYEFTGWLGKKKQLPVEEQKAWIPEAKDDWKKEGYKITHEYDKHGILFVFVKAPDGSDAGEFQFVDDHPQAEGGLFPMLAEVPKEHRRKGIASAVYDYAQEVSGLPVNPSISQTPDAKRFWMDRLGEGLSEQSTDAERAIKLINGAVSKIQYVANLSNVKINTDLDELKKKAMYLAKYPECAQPGNCPDHVYDDLIREQVNSQFNEKFREILQELSKYLKNLKGVPSQEILKLFATIEAEDKKKDEVFDEVNHDSTAGRDSLSLEFPFLPSD